ncbi:MAG TPA: T9SS type A sorting domain-containing protein [Chitinophagaceae bacterium]|nr:T9SS type A sorting domain-containing protein [Chitinophagaceae bacterium]
MNHFYAGRKQSLFLAFSLCLSSFGLAATFTVSNTNDTGPGSLRQAIIDANATPGVDQIVFAIPGAGPHTIMPFAPLDQITEQVTIDGYSQSGSVAGSIDTRTIMINIDGTNAGGTAVGLTVNADDVVIDGLAIHSFTSDGIYVMPGADNVFIWGNYIGTNSAGITDLGNGGHGVNFDDIAPGVGGGTGGNNGSVVGTNGDESLDGVEGNLISGNELDGIGGWAITNSTFAGNIIGLDRTGTVDLGNTRNGILLTVNATNNTLGTDGDGASDEEEGNIISGNNANGISIIVRSNTNIIAGNTIGLDINEAAVGNTLNGIQIINSSFNRVGVNSGDLGFAVEGNTISANGTNGIYISSELLFFSSFFDADASSNIVSGNYIGTTSANAVRGNGNAGVFLNATNAFNVTSSNIIGSNGDGATDAAEGNWIAYNTNDGIVTNNDPDVLLNRFSRNSSYLNGQLGIDLADDGVSSNDDGDGDTGPNTLLNFPVITSVTVNEATGGGTFNLIVSGFARPGTLIEFYLADAGPNPNPLPGGYTRSFGEGQTYLFRGLEGGTVDGLVTDADATTGTYNGADEGTGTGGTRTENRFSFTIPLSSLAAPVTGGSRLTAIALDALAGAANTSEFSGVFSAITTPVTFASFTGRLDNGKVTLQWKTGAELNNSNFEIERSADGRGFSKIGNVAARGSSSSYEFVDAAPLSKINYYRLKQLDVDSKHTYSKVLIIRADLGKLEMKIAPNPVVNSMNISFRAEEQQTVRISFYDQMGRLAKRYSVSASRGVNSITLNDLNSLPAGNYAVEVVGENFSAKQQIIKK